MELPVVLPLAAVAGLVTLLVCDLSGGIARAKGRSYWGYFALGLLLWFPGLIAALAVRPRTQAVAAPAPGRVEQVVALLLLALGALAAAAGFAAAVAYAP